MISSPIHFKSWIDDHRHLLKPPVGNQQVFKDGEYIIMVVGGPNSRKDYHVDPSPEFFYQLEGDMILKIIDDGKLRDLVIREGDIFLLPSNVPHSPQRLGNTVGLVIESARKPGELDGFQWYCEHCGHKLYEVFVQVTDIVKQLPPLFSQFFSSLEDRTCKKCGEVLPEPPS